MHGLKLIFCVTITLKIWMHLKLILYPDYLKHSPVNATDRQDVKEALQSVSKAAKHFEEMIKRDVSLIPDLMAREIKTRIAVILEWICNTDQSIMNM